jgi:hypothetical protein
MSIRFSVNKAMVVLLVLVAQVAFAQAVWDGTADTTWYTSNKSATEFTITTAEQLAGLARLVSGGVGNGTYDMTGKTIMLASNITLNDTTNWKNWENSPPVHDWLQIGYYGNVSFPFNGTFDGKGYIVSGIYINSNEDTQGLFGLLGGTIKNLGIIAFYIKGQYAVGGLVGRNRNGTISNSYSSGTVTSSAEGFFSHVGGLVGQNTDGTISNSYSASIVKGLVSAAGGLIGSNSDKGVISNCYSIGMVKNTEPAAFTSNSYYFFGGLVGNNAYGNGTVSNSYYDRQTSMEIDVGKGDGKKTAQMKRIATYIGWDFDEVWGRRDDINNGYPYLRRNVVAENLPNNEDRDYDGSYEHGEPDITWYTSNDVVFTITTVEQLAGLAVLVNEGNDFKDKTINLGANIMFNDTTNWKNWTASDRVNNIWIPIGTNYPNPVPNIKKFEGTFDGKGYVISGIYIVSASDHQGLFGYVGSNGTIKNLGVTASYISPHANKAGIYVGGLAGIGYGIKDSFFTGEVTGEEHVGGLTGEGSAENSHFVGNVKGTNYVGGLVGEGRVSSSHFTGAVVGKEKVGGLVGYSRYNDQVNSSYFVGIVKGTNYVGGIVGYKGTYGHMNSSYSIGEVIGAKYIGGLAGYNYSSDITSSYFEGRVSGDSCAGGLVGLNEDDGKIRSGSYSIGKVEGTNSVGGLIGCNNDSQASEMFPSIKESYSFSAVTGTGYYVGGLVGNNSNGRIHRSYSAGKVEGKEYVGGLVGENNDANGIRSCYSTGTVKGEHGVGGLVGYNGPNGTVYTSYSIGKVEGTYHSVGGFVGTNIGRIYTSYYDRETSGNITSVDGNGYAKTTAEMKQQSTFVSWEFRGSEAVWGIDSKINCGYPYLLNFDYGEGEECNKEECEATGKVWENNFCRAKTMTELAQECEAAGNTLIGGTCMTTSTIRSPQIASSQIIARTTSNGIILENLPSNVKVKVYNLHGKRIYNSQFSTLNSQFIETHTKGIYIIKIGTQTFHMAVK